MCSPVLRQVCGLVVALLAVNGALSMAAGVLQAEVSPVGKLVRPPTALPRMHHVVFSADAAAAWSNAAWQAGRVDMAQHVAHSVNVALPDNAWSVWVQMARAHVRTTPAAGATVALHLVSEAFAAHPEMMEGHGVSPVMLQHAQADYLALGVSAVLACRRVACVIGR